MTQIDLAPYMKSFFYNGKCNDYDDHGELESSLFNNATEMASVVDDENSDVVNLTYAQFKSILGHNYPVPQGCIYQLNTDREIAWIYNEVEDIHYFFTYKK